MASGTPTKMTWDGPADQQLLFAILTEHSISVDFEKVADRLGCTGRAVQERLKKLKKMAAEQDDSPASATKPAASKKPDGDKPTPKRRAAAPKSQKAGTGAKGVKGKMVGKDQKSAIADGEGELETKVKDEDEDSGSLGDDEHGMATVHEPYYQPYMTGKKRKFVEDKMLDESAEA